MKIIGHRGAAGLAPENTLLSIRKALEIGVDAIEFDVFCLPTGEVVLMHDTTVTRTTSGEGWVHSYTFEELRNLDAGQGQCVPTLSEALTVINGHTMVNIELKGPATARPVADIITKHLAMPAWSSEKFMVSSFNYRELRDFKEYMPQIAIGALEGGVPLGLAAAAQEVGAIVLSLNHEHTSSEFVADAHGRGLKVFVYTVNELPILRYLQRIGVDGIFTNYPDRMKALLKGKSRIDSKIA